MQIVCLQLGSVARHHFSQDGVCVRIRRPRGLGMAIDPRLERAPALGWNGGDRSVKRVSFNYGEASMVLNPNSAPRSVVLRRNIHRKGRVAQFVWLDPNMVHLGSVMRADASARNDRLLWRRAILGGRRI
jgi:hypothetical protein